MIILIAYFLAGMAGLWIGAELLVRYASRFAAAIGISPLIVGLSVVSFGTSAPEFVVSLIAILQEDAGISVGNIVGSNIANLGLILGIGALITPLEVKINWVKREVPIMIGVTMVFIILAFFGRSLGRPDGILLVILMILFLYYLARFSISQMAEFRDIQQKAQDISKNKAPSGRQKAGYLVLSLVGVVILVGGSKLTVDSAVQMALIFGVSDLIIGLTLIALGTSLPELATTIVGAIRKETDIVVGNVIGSNIFNLLFIGGVIPIIHSLSFSPVLFYLHFPILMLLSILILPMMRIELNLRRLEGLLLLIIYLVFIYLTVTVQA